MEPVDDVRAISHIAYGFMASKALFAALNLDIFSHLFQGPRHLEDLCTATGISSGRLQALLAACTSVGLLEKSGDLYANAPASGTYLVRGAPMYFGDYFRFQIDRQVYPAFMKLDEALHGHRTNFYSLMENPEEAEHFSRAQHTGSLGPARVLAKMVDLSACRRLLDVGGGTGAFSITLCRRYPDLLATIVDFPNVQTIAERQVREAGLAERITYLPGSALGADWPEEQDAVLMSYLLSAVSEANAGELIDRAGRALRPGGQLILHDFMIQDDRSGPSPATLWLLSAVLMDPEAPSLTPEWLSALLSRRGFAAISVADVIPTITKVVMARKALT